MKKQDEGFTLIELLIVIIILGILATVVVFAVAGIRDSGDKSACEAELRSVETALEAYYAENGVYTGTATVLDAEYFRSDRAYWAYGITAGGYGYASAETAPAAGTTQTNAVGAAIANCG
jgi:prepilin-type N-terminal cleavage/methylation domain-containing protein